MINKSQLIPTNNIDLNDNQYWVGYHDYVWKGQRDDDGVWLKEKL